MAIKTRPDGKRRCFTALPLKFPTTEVSASRFTRSDGLFRTFIHASPLSWGSVRSIQTWPLYLWLPVACVSWPKLVSRWKPWTWALRLRWARSVRLFLGPWWSSSLCHSWEEARQLLCTWGLQWSSVLMMDYCLSWSIFSPNQRQRCLKVDLLKDLRGVAAKTRDSQSFERRHISKINIIPLNKGRNSQEYN